MDNKGYFYYIWCCFFSNVIKNSVIYKWLTGFYGGISKRWNSSAICRRFKKARFDEDFITKSLFGKILRIPFSILDFIRTRFSEKLTRQKENSFVIKSCKYLLHNFLALNLRFIGVLAVSAAAFDIVFSLVLGGGFVISVLILLFGIILCAFPVNFTDYLKNSAVFRAVGYVLGTEFSYDFYYVTKCGKGAKLYSAVFFGAAAGALSAAVSPVLGVLFIAGLLYAFAVLYKTEFGVYTTAFLAPIVPTMVLAALCLLTGASLVIRSVTEKKFRWKFGGCEFFVMLLITVFLFAAVTSFSLKKSVEIWILYAVFMGFYFVVSNTLKTKKQFFDLITVMVLSCLAVCLYGIMQYAFGWNTAQAWMDEEMFEDIKMRIYSTLENPNVLGEYILLMLPLSVGLMWTKKNAVSKIFYAAVSGCLLLALILTFSRGCWIGLIFAAAIFVTLVSGKLWGLLLIVLPFVPMLLPESIINRFLSVGDMKDSSTSYRVYIWLGTMLMLKDYWISGIGLGSEAFTRIYPFYSYSSIVAPHAHNMFLQILVESGIVGISAFLIMLFAFFKRLSVIHAMAGRKSPVSTMIVAFAAAVSGFLLQGMFDNCFYNYRVFMIFWLTLSVGLCSFGAQQEYLKETADKKEGEK